MVENVLSCANVRLVFDDQKTAERIPQVVRSEPLTRIEEQLAIGQHRLWGLSGLAPPNMRSSTMEYGSSCCPETDRRLRCPIKLRRSAVGAHPRGPDYCKS
jgi:hypothetical protein